MPVRKSVLATVAAFNVGARVMSKVVPVVARADVRSWPIHSGGPM